MAEVIYEVYIRVNDRWTIEARYSNMEREVAIEDAKSMHSNPNVKAVRVIKETFDAATNASNEVTVFSTEPVAGKAGPSFADMEVNVGGPDFADMEFDMDQAGAYDDPLPARKPKKARKPAKASGKSPVGTIFLKIMMVTTFSLGFAFFMTYLSTEGYFG